MPNNIFGKMPSVDLAAIMSSNFIRVKVRPINFNFIIQLDNISKHTHTFQLVAFVHFVLIANALLGTFLPASYLFYNLLFLLALFWTIHCKESVDAIHTVSYSIFFSLLNLMRDANPTHICNQFMMM